MEFKEQKPRIVAVLHSVFATLKSSLSTSFSGQLLLYYALIQGRLVRKTCQREQTNAIALLHEKFFKHGASQ